MTDDQKLEAFFNAVTIALPKTYTNFHWPDDMCVTGSCKGFGLSKAGPFARGVCNWDDTHLLVARFFHHGPDVDAEWKRLAGRIGFEPGDFHELLLGVFIAADRGSIRFNTKFFEGGPPKLINDTGYFSPRQIPENPNLKGTP